MAVSTFTKVDDDGALGPLTPRQRDLMDRVQLVCVVMLVLLPIAVAVLDAFHVLSYWRLMAVGLVIGTCVCLLAGPAVARIEGSTLRQVIGRTNRSIVSDSRARLARLRERLRR